jgi:hypothetical protein
MHQAATLMQYNNIVTGIAPVPAEFTYFLEDCVTAFVF